MRRRWWLVVLCVLAVGALADVIADRVEPEYYAESVLLVPAGGPGTPPPGDADGAQRLARTYASVIPTDPAVLAAATQVAGLPQERLEEGLDVVYEPNTALFRISYTGVDPAITLAAVQAVTSVVGSATPPPTITPGSIQVVRVPAEAVALPSTSEQAVPIGIAVGLALGLLLAVVFERSSNHLDSPALLARRTGSPASPVRDLTPAGAQALVARWQELARREDAMVSLVPVVEGQTAVALSAARRLAHLAEQRGLRVNVVDDRPDRATADGAESAPSLSRLGSGWPEASLTLAVSGVPGGPESGELTVTSADLCVVVVREGTRGARVTGALETMEQFGVRPAWALLAPRPGLWSRLFRGSDTSGKHSAAASAGERGRQVRQPQSDRVDGVGAPEPAASRTVEPSEVGPSAGDAVPTRVTGARRPTAQ